MIDPNKADLAEWDRIEDSPEDDSDCEAALDQALQKKGIDPARYEIEDDGSDCALLNKQAS